MFNILKRQRVILDILHTTAGHVTISFDVNKPNEAKMAKQQITDLLKQGYAIFVDTPDGEKRVTGFDPATGTYKIGDKAIGASKTKGTAVAPTAGGCPVDKSIAL